MSALKRRAVYVGILTFVVFAEATHAANPVPRQSDFTPDPATVQRCGPAYRYPQAGWIVLHIEGEPYERGYQHGKLLAPEIVDYIKALASFRSAKAPADGWRDMRLIVNALFLRRYDKEYLEEMKGIADGAAAAGAKFDGKLIDFVDIVTLNSSIEIDFLPEGLDATPTGLEGLRFPEPPYAKPERLPPAPNGTRSRRTPHCSAFVATSPATADGKIVFGHITMWHLYLVRHFNVWIDVKPAKGRRVVMQSFAGSIMSGLDYYINDGGLLVAETTIRQTKFDITGASMVSRIRQAVQYADSIDGFVKIMSNSNNGLYTNEWLLADIKTNEIGMFELGTHKHRLWRSSKDEWIGGTKGFYWGCNNAKDLQVRLETIPSVDGKPANLVFRPSDRDIMWQRLYEKHKGKITAEFGFEAFTTPPIAGFPSCDAKFTTTALAKEMKSWALFGPPLGRTWDATEAERNKYSDIQPLVSNDWALIAPPARIAGDGTSLAVDLAPSWEQEQHEEEALGELPPAWRGTILPKTDADIWLAAAFSDYEKIVALEKALKARAKDGKLSEEDQDRLEVALFGPLARYKGAAQRRGADLPAPFKESKPEMSRNEWYDITAGRGVLFLAALRKELGAEAFDQTMDGFGRTHGGKEVTTAEFFAAVEKAHGRTLGLLTVKPRKIFAWETEFDRMLRAAFWSIHSFEQEPESALIIYGTQKDAAAQREAAELLQRQIARRWRNYTIPIKSDKEVTEEELKSHHLLLIGRPDSNAVAARCSKELPLKFGSGSFVLRGKTYAHAKSAVIVAGSNPLNSRYSVVLYAGLSAEATWRCVQQIGEDDRDSKPAPVMLLAAGAKPRLMVAAKKD